ncbi:hypothetical protein AVEN_144448-1 [Araneus ventricosus]|uniref:Uncharacterized protein n=1 Tax=Araneus ventricosus TaxID=182803 RepID=A0A4Y2E2W8_ARAVE|nr:hypothetical protein AVEN_144448-1 [Araneus ventricosus]
MSVALFTDINKESFDLAIERVCNTLINIVTNMESRFPAMLVLWLGPRSGFLQMIPCDVTACRGDYKWRRAWFTGQSLIDLERVQSSLDFERVDQLGSSLECERFGISLWSFIRSAN